MSNFKFVGGNPENDPVGVDFRPYVYTYLRTYEPRAYGSFSAISLY
jgi:hypothetical protein